MAEGDERWSLEQALFEELVLVCAARDFASQAPHVNLSIGRDTATVAETTRNTLKLNVLEA